MVTRKKICYRDILLVLLIGIISAFSFYPSLYGNFVFDDIEAVVTNKDVFPDTPIINIFKNDFWGTTLLLNTSHKSYRPLTIISFRINIWLNNGILDPYYFHLTNIILHSISTILTFPIFIKIFKEPRPIKSSIASLLFATHPVHSEAICGIVGRAELLCCVLSLMALLLYFPAVNTKFVLNTVIYSVLTSIVAGLATFSKEQGITILGICLMYDIFLFQYKITDMKSKLKRKRNIFYFQPGRLFFIRNSIILISGSFIIYSRCWIMNFDTPNFQPVDNPASFMTDIFSRIINYNYLYCLNIFILLCPIWLCFDWSMGCISLIQLYQFPPDLRLLSVLLFWCISTLIIWKCIFHLQTINRLILMALGFLIIPFIVASNLFFRVGFVIAERILYIPSIGYCMLLALGIKKIYYGTKHKNLVVIAFIFVVVINIMRCYERSLKWQNEKSLFESGVNVCPNNAKIYYNLAKTTDNNSLSIDYYNKALSLHPEYEQAMNNLANILRDKGNLTEAEHLLTSALKIRSNFPAAWMNLGIILANMERYEESEEAYYKALMYRRNYPDCLYNLGNLFLAQNRYDDAYYYWEQAVSLKPSHSIAWSNMIVLLDSKNNWAKGEIVAKEALKHLPNDGALHFNLGNILGKQDKFEEAEKHFSKAIQLKSGQPLYHINFGVLYHRWKKYKQAEIQYEIALGLNPSSVSALENLKSHQGVSCRTKAMKPYDDEGLKKPQTFEAMSQILVSYTTKTQLF